MDVCILQQVTFFTYSVPTGTVVHINKSHITLYCMNLEYGFCAHAKTSMSVFVAMTRNFILSCCTAEQTFNVTGTKLNNTDWFWSERTAPFHRQLCNHDESDDHQTKADKATNQISSTPCSYLHHLLLKFYFSAMRGSRYEVCFFDLFLANKDYKYTTQH